MSNTIPPEILALEELLGALLNGDQRNAAVTEIAVSFAAIVKEEPSDAWWTLHRAIGSLDQFTTALPSRGAVAVAEGVVQAFRRIFGPDRTFATLGDFLARNQTDTPIALHGLAIFEDLAVDRDTKSKAAEALTGEIEALRGLVSSASDLPEASQVILMRQLDHLAASLASFRDGSVVPFRRELYTAYGRLILELEPLSKKNAGAVEVILEKLHKIGPAIEGVANVAGISSPILSIAAPAVKLAITHKSDGNL